MVGDCEHHKGNTLPTDVRNKFAKRSDVHVAFERMPILWLATFRNDDVNGLCSHELHIRSRSVEVRVVRNNIAFLASHAEQNALGGAALVCRNHICVSKDVLDRTTEPLKALAAGITLVPFHHRRPLMSGHGAGSGIGEQINQYIIRK